MKREFQKLTKENISNFPSQRSRWKLVGYKFLGQN